MTENNKTMPVIALRGMMILPGVVAHFDISREKSVLAVEEAMRYDQMIILLTQLNPEEENPGTEGLSTIGVAAEIKQVIKMQNDIIRILVTGKYRVRTKDLTDQESPFFMAVVDEEEEEEILPFEAKEAMARIIRETFQRFSATNPKLGKELPKQVEEKQELEPLMELIVGNMPVNYLEKQKYLEAESLTERYEFLISLLLREININTIKNEFQSKVKERVDKNQKEYLLREQMKVIREELGEDNTESDTDRFYESLKKLKASKEIKEKIRKEIDRFKNIASSSQESTVTRGYIETLLDLPWDKTSKDRKDLKNARKVLDEDHYGLPKVKERILEFLAVRNLTSKGDSPIICLVGPPGTGKTSIAHSVARALGKEYVRISLGGVRDEAEIRGHRRTYVGAMPGRIASGLRLAGVRNPLMILDEIDKVSGDHRGDTASALLEVLDSEQNKKFRDHYVELPLDLSDVLFIATANSVQDIPRPLLDRMELIEVTSYTENEKLHIGEEYLLPKQISRHGLKKGQLTIRQDAFELLIRGYTREAGVRNLERKLGELCRKAALAIYENNKKKIQITRKNLESYLGKQKYTYDMANETDEIGIVRGLAWTSVGGDTLEIEVNIMPGKGEIQLTGQMGDVMKESAKTGISYIRSKSRELEIPDAFFRENDIHIHIPEGAVPKDGPSAGITMATAMISAIQKVPVRADVAMTGEITLRGRVLPIGGLKEKTLAARNAGIHTICVPRKNEKDMLEISEEITKGLEIIYADTMDDVLRVAMAEKQ